MINIFDKITAGDLKAAEKSDLDNHRITPEDVDINNKNDDLAQIDAHSTSAHIKEVSQELIKHGIIEASTKFEMYRVTITNQSQINRIIEPLDLKIKVDDVRGLAFLIVNHEIAEEINSKDDEWTHPLVRKQRLNLEQSLLIAILRKHFIAHELDAGIGGTAIVHLDDLLPELNSYLGELGSEMREDKRLRTLLEQLKGYGLVTDINKQEQISIRPLIAHVANPENLKNLLADFIAASEAREINEQIS